jgi:multisubunit Na+/H+ antiporter MnhG subunit
VSSHALARASHAIGIYETEATVVDQLEEPTIEPETEQAE